MRQTLPSLGYLQPILNSDFRRKSDNIKVRAQLNPPRTSATGGLELQMRLLKTGPNTRLIPGDVVIGNRGRKYLLLGQGKDERNTEGQGVFKSVELDRKTVLLRATKTTDPITKRTNEGLVVMGTIEYAEIPLRQSEDTLQIPYNNYEVLTDYPLQIGDKIREGIFVATMINQIVTYAKAQTLPPPEGGYGYGEAAYGEFGYGGGSVNSDLYGTRTLVVRQVEQRFGAYWARVQDA